NEFATHQLSREVQIEDSPSLLHLLHRFEDMTFNEVLRLSVNGDCQSGVAKPVTLYDGEYSGGVEDVCTEIVPYVYCNEAVESPLVEFRREVDAFRGVPINDIAAKAVIVSLRFIRNHVGDSQ